MTLWDEWKTAGWEAPPMGEFLRVTYADRWLRIHNLLGGKRIATRDSEQTELLQRNNVAASAVLGDGSDCVAIATEWETIPLTKSWTRAPKPPKWKLDEDDAELVGMANFRFQPLQWQPQAFDDAIAAVACGELGRLVVFARTRAAAYCPYDGGADLLLPTAQEAAALREQFSAWRVNLVDGL
jgi:hypothetical protein